ncbi:MAG: hypothetical protein HOW73_21005 [Polyangiaceae bacterium]|nr:hypothetical protein [Polyangiaceae bacterium]
MIKRRIIMGLLALGTIGGFAAGFGSLACHGRERRERWKEEVAETCIRAAKNVDAEDRGGERPADDDDDDHHHHRGHR